MSNFCPIADFLSRSLLSLGRISSQYAECGEAWLPINWGTRLKSISSKDVLLGGCFHHDPSFCVLCLYKSGRFGGSISAAKLLHTGAFSLGQSLSTLHYVR